MKTILLLTFILFTVSQIDVLYYGSSVCQNRTQFEYAFINPTCVNTQTGSTQLTCTANTKTAAIYKNNNCPPPAYQSSTGTLPTNQCNVISNAVNETCEFNPYIQGALVKYYTDNQCSNLNTYFAVYNVGTCLYRFSYGSSYVKYTCTPSALNINFYNDSLCTNVVMQNQTISTPICAGLSLNYNTLVNCNYTYTGEAQVITSRMISSSTFNSFNMVLLLFALILTNYFPLD